MWREYLRELPEAGAPAGAHAGGPADLARLPAAYIEPQEIDTLRDEAAAYAEALRDAGTTVEVNEVPGSYHGLRRRHRKSLCTSSGRQTYLCHAGHAGQYQ